MVLKMLGCIIKKEKQLLNTIMIRQLLFLTKESCKTSMVDLIFYTQCFIQINPFAFEVLFIVTPVFIWVLIWVVVNFASLSTNFEKKLSSPDIPHATIMSRYGDSC